MFLFSCGTSPPGSADEGAVKELFCPRRAENLSVRLWEVTSGANTLAERCASPLLLFASPVLPEAGKGTVSVPREDSRALRDFSERRLYALDLYLAVLRTKHTISPAILLKANTRPQPRR